MRLPLAVVVLAVLIAGITLAVGASGGWSWVGGALVATVVAIEVGYLAVAATRPGRRAV